MKSKEEIANKHGILSGKDSEFDDSILKAMQEYANQCQEDMSDKKLYEDDIKEMALDFIINTGGLPKTIEEWKNALWKFYESLNKQH